MTSRLTTTFQKTFSSLHTRNFRLFFIGQTISNTGNWLTNVTLTLLILHLTNSGAAVGLLAACQYGPILLLSIWAGAIADRSNKRNLLLITQTLEMLESFGLAALAFMHNPPVVAFYAIAAIGGILLAFDNPLRRSFVGEMVRTEEIPNAVVLNSTIVNVSRILGPALAGVFVVTIGYGWCFVLDAISYVAVISSLLMMRMEELRRTQSKPGVGGEVREGFGYVLSKPTLWIPFVMLGIIGTFAYNFSVTLPLFVKHSLHGDNRDYTLLYSVFGAGALISGLSIAHRNLAKMRYVIAGAMMLGIAMLLLAVIPGIVFAIPVIFFVGLTSILYMNSTTASIQVEAESRFHGRVLALQTVFLVGTTPIGGPLLGLLADVVGARTPILLGALSCIAAGVFGLIAHRQVVRTTSL